MLRSEEDLQDLTNFLHTKACLLSTSVLPRGIAAAVGELTGEHNTTQHLNDPKHLLRRLYEH